MARTKANEEVEPSEEDKVTIDENSIGEAADVVEEWDAIDAEESGVYYAGIFSERRISKEDWEKAGVPNQEVTVWRKDSGKRLPLDMFSEKALETLRGTGEFRIVTNA